MLAPGLLPLLVLYLHLYMSLLWRQTGYKLNDIGQTSNLYLNTSIQPCITLHTLLLCTICLLANVSTKTTTSHVLTKRRCTVYYIRGSDEAKKHSFQGHVGLNGDNCKVNWEFRGTGILQIHLICLWCVRESQRSNTKSDDRSIEYNSTCEPKRVWYNETRIAPKRQFTCIDPVLIPNVA